MRNRIYILLASVLLLMFSPGVSAHISHSGEGLISILLHPFTGVDHILTLILVGVGIAYSIHRYSKPNK